MHQGSFFEHPPTTAKIKTIKGKLDLINHPSHMSLNRSSLVYLHSLMYKLSLTKKNIYFTDRVMNQDFAIKIREAN